VSVAGALVPADSGATVQAYDATILKSADIGSTVQAYDADTAKLDVAQSWTAQQTFKELKDTVKRFLLDKKRGIQLSNFMGNFTN
jgi:hypothetical protein